jgi:hypothetical protein
MTNGNTLENWRPNLLIYVNCFIAIVLIGSAFSWVIALMIASENTVKAAMVGAGLFVSVFWLSLRRCSTPALPAFRGLLLITAYMTIGMGSFSLLLVVPAVVFAIIATIAIGLASLFRKDSTYAAEKFRHVVEFYRKHRMYQ